MHIRARLEQEALFSQVPDLLVRSKEGRAFYKEFCSSGVGREDSKNRKPSHSAPEQPLLEYDKEKAYLPKYLLGYQIGVAMPVKFNLILDLPITILQSLGKTRSPTNNLRERIPFSSAPKSFYRNHGDSGSLWRAFDGHHS